MTAHLREGWRSLRTAAYQVEVSIAEQRVSDWGPNYVGQDNIEREARAILSREGWSGDLYVRSSSQYDSFFASGAQGADAEAFVSDPVNNSTGETLPGVLLMARSAGIRRLVLIHECAHVLVGLGHSQPHGQEFVRTYVRLLRTHGMDGAANMIGFMTGIDGPDIEVVER